MTGEYILQAHLDKVDLEKEKIKSQMKSFFDENKDNDDIELDIKEKFSPMINDFEREYNMTFPLKISDNIILKRIAFVKTVEMYLDLVHYPKKLLEDYLLDNPSS